ncbi:DUF3841 domain-containing protein [Wukongibacter baidiensis]|uniref:DUF3841 domain-containing protein n=1 Tax=Wukongibacter baidiensis TaxID=1723361 RepID=UPI003D7F6EB0
MDSKDNKVTLYTTQNPIVIDTLEEKGVYHVKKEFIEMKYREVSHIFLQCYDWFVSKAKNIVAKPEGAEYPIWTYIDAKYSGYFEDSYLLELEVPIEDIIFFKMEDWNRILNLRYLPKNSQDGLKYDNKLKSYNIQDETEIFMNPYYPQLKSEVRKSWDNLFKHNEIVKSNRVFEGAIQGSLWEIKKSWLVDVKKG